MGTNTYFTAGEVTGGSVTGPALNATVIGGTAYPFVKADSSATFANNVISGRTNDGVPFLVQDNGVGPGRNQQFTWLVSCMLLDYYLPKYWDET